MLSSTITTCPANPSLTLICPTIGRRSLRDVIKQVAPQLRDGDQFIIVGDGPQPEAEKALQEFKDESPHRGGIILYCHTPKKIGDFGCTPCDYAIDKFAKGDFIFFTGDDDIVVEDAFHLIRKNMAGPIRPHIFSMHHSLGLLRNSRACCAVSGQQIIVPNVRGRIPKMAEYEPHAVQISDWVFIDKVLNEWEKEGFEYHDEIINILLKQNHGANA